MAGQGVEMGKTDKNYKQSINSITEHEKCFETKINRVKTQRVESVRRRGNPSK